MTELQKLFRRSVIRGIPVIFLFIGMLTTAVRSQSLLDNWNARRSALFEWYKPTFANSDPYSYTSSTLYLDLRVPATDNITFEADLPWIYSDLKSAEFPDYNNRETYGFGNPYLGVELHKAMSVLFLQAGLRLPLAHFNTWPSQYLGQYSDINRPGAFFDRAWTYRLMGGIHYENVTGFGVRASLGPNIVVNHQFNAGNFYLNYNAQLRFDARLFEIGGGIQGNALLNQKNNSGSRLVNEVFLEGSTNVGFLQPGMYLALPIDKHSMSIIKYVIGFYLHVRIGAF